MVPWTPCFPLTGGWCGPPGRCILACSRRVVETSRTDLRYRLNAGGRGYSGGRDRGYSGGQGRGYSGGQDRGYSGGQDRGFSGGGGGGVVGLCALDADFRRTVEDAAKKAMEKAGGGRQKPRWEREKEKREKAEARLEATEKEMENIKKVSCSVTGVYCKHAHPS